MKRRVAMIAIVLGLSAGIVRVDAGVINGSFETGDLTGWSESPAGLSSVVSSYGTYTPYRGTRFAVIAAGEEDVYTTLSQSFFASAGEILSGAAFFQANDYLPFDDDAYVRIVENGEILFSSNVSAVGDFGGTPWTYFSYQFQSAGVYTIEAGVRNALDTSLSSVLGLDAVTATFVPEPTTIASAGLAGLVGLGYALRRRKGNVIA